MQKRETEVLAKKQVFTSRLLEWHRSNRASYPWRETTDPYKILIAEMLLRKTTRKQVDRIFPKFVTAYPDAQSLANASVPEIRKLITPLGMEWKRASGMKRLARELMKTGGVPLDKQQLRSLPGVGEYIANAVLCFGAAQDLPLVDTNLARVLQRVFSVRSSRKRPRTDPEIWNFASSLLPSGRSKELSLSLIDFAATVCTARTPNCASRPLNNICDSWAEHVSPYRIGSRTDNVFAP